MLFVDLTVKWKKVKRADEGHNKTMAKTKDTPILLFLFKNTMLKNIHITINLVIHPIQSFAYRKLTAWFQNEYKTTISEIPYKAMVKGNQKVRLIAIQPMIIPKQPETN